MSLLMFVLWVLAGLLAGLLAGVITKRGGHGLRWDMILGLAGSIVVSAIFQALGIAPDAGMVALVMVAFVGAAGVIGVQRAMWPTVA
jgi:uncharacterized membrane protein YeaQ/YmgE (transglycosylase-associated protein family)